MNVYDSQRMEELFMPFGYEIIDNYENADLVILNTCHIREKAAEKVYSELGRINQVKQKRSNPMLISVAGCVAQAEGAQIIKRAPFVDVVVGPQSYHMLPSLVAKIELGLPINKISLEFIEEEKFDLLPEARTNSQISSFVSVQEGCDKFCTFCVVPYTRGAEFSRPVEKIKEEIKTLIEQGCKEITLLGQNVNGYHGQNKEGKVSNLGQLILEIDKIEGLHRIRYVTSHPRDMHDELYEAHATSKKLMPFLHLPVQSGSNKVLKAMNRKHTGEEYLEILKKLKIARPDLMFSSDFIVGFPGETEEDFQDTINLVKQVNYGQCFSFKYSPRPGTPAALKKNQVPEEVKQERLVRLQAILNEQQYNFNKSLIGKEVEVLFERKQGDKLIGRSPFLQSVVIDFQEEFLNKIKKVTINSASPHNLKA